MTQLTWDAIAGYVYATGLRGEPAAIAVAITQPESGRDPGRLNDNKRTGDLSYGLWQINMLGDLGPDRRRRYALKANSDLYDPATNARAMYGISSGGTNWNPWTTYKNGKHRAYLNDARAAVKAVEARNGATGGSSSAALEATVTGPLAGEAKPPGGGLAAAVYVTPTFPGLAIPSGYGDIVSRLGLEGQVSLSVNSVSEITLTIAAARDTGVWSDLLIFSEVRLYDMVLVITDHQWGERDGVEVLNVTLQPAGVQKLRRPTVGRTWNNASPSQVLNDLVKAAGLRFYGKATAQRSQIVQLDADASQGRDVAESAWELGQRLAREEGFWWFEAGGAVYFAPPTWLRDSATRFPVRNNAAPASTPFDALGWVEAGASLNVVRNKTLQIREIHADLPRWRGEQVRPGMCAVYSGTPGWGSELLVVTDVTWALDGGVSPTQITATSPIDPTPEPAQDDVALIGADSTTPTAGASSGGSRPVSGGGRGTYGYQYDPPGTQASGGPQPGTLVLRDTILHRFPKAKDSGLYVPRTVDGTTKLSAHAEGRAFDAGVPKSSQLGRDIANFLVANAALLGIQLIIWDGRKWNAGVREWGVYAPPNGKKDDTSMHRDHVHMEQCWEAAKHLTAMQAVGGVNG